MFTLTTLEEAPLAGWGLHLNCVEGPWLARAGVEEEVVHIEFL